MLGTHPLPDRSGPPAKRLSALDRAEDVARAVAFGAVAGAVDQIGAAVPLRRFAGIRRERLAVNEQEIPAANQPAPTEWQRQLVRRRLASDYGQRVQIGEQITRVIELDALVGRIRERRIIVLAVRRRAFQQCRDEIRLAPGPDPILSIGRDVGRKERAERRDEREAAAEMGWILLAGRGVARRAAARVEHDLAVGEIRVCAAAARLPTSRAGRGDDPEDREAARPAGLRAPSKLCATTVSSPACASISHQNVRLLAFLFTENS